MSNEEEPTFKFGKYRGMKVSECTDIDYLQWFLDNVKDVKTLKAAIILQIREINRQEFLYK